eukprot:6819879-Prymnesium_polylepis.1
MLTAGRAAKLASRVRVRAGMRNGRIVIIIIIRRVSTGVSKRSVNVNGAHVAIENVLVESNRAGDNKLVCAGNPDVPATLIAGRTQVEAGYGNITELRIAVDFIGEGVRTAAENLNVM